MNKNVFYNLLEKPAAIDSSNQRSLQFVINEFPWFTTARLLSLKALNSEDHFSYPTELKLTSLYAHDRKKLFELIHTHSNLLFEHEPHLVEKEEHFADALAETIPFSEEPLVEPVVDEVPQLDEQEEIIETIEVEITQEDSLKQLIENRLKELALASEESISEVETAFLPVTSEESTETVEEINLPVEIIEDSFETDVLIFSPTENSIDASETPELDLEIEKSALEAELILEVLNLPETISEKADVEYPSIIEVPIELIAELDSLKVDAEPDNVEVEVKPDTTSAHSFTQWMQLLKGQQVISKQEEKQIEQPKAAIKEIIQPVKKEESVAEQVKIEKASVKPDADLINKFLIEDPRIEIRKQEFYSPNNMARKGLEIHDDLVSETLADIYMQQGLHDKALFAYEKLILKYPEKNIFFAARIKKIKALINSK